VICKDFLTYCSIASGTAGKLIEACTSMYPQRGYDEILRLLFEQYGHSHLIAHACVKIAVDCLQVQFNDAGGLCGFAQCLRDCYLTLSEIDQFAEVDYLPTLMEISNRLSFKLLDPWRRRVAQITKAREQRRTPPGTRVKASLNAISKDEPKKCPCCTKPRRLTHCLAFEKMDQSEWR